jgi:ATPase family associated with various cellular activities (AAA)
MMALASTPQLEPNPLLSMIRKPDQLLCPTGLVFTKGEKFMRRHMLKLMGSASQETAEIFALLQGPPGTGKTVLATDALLRGGFTVANIPVSLLAGATENAATDALSDFMRKMVAYSQATGARMAAVFDDFHQGIAGNMDDKIGKTVNTGLVLNELQRIADPPRKYRSACGTPITLVFTGNDFSGTSPSLFRDMRANKFTHNPTFEEKIHIIFNMLKPQTGTELRLVEKLVSTYRRQPIAFFTALRNDLLSSHLDDALPDGPITKQAVDALWPKHLPLKADLVWALAKERAADTLINHY